MHTPCSPRFGGLVISPQPCVRTANGELWGLPPHHGIATMADAVAFPLAGPNPPRPVLAAPQICQWLARRSSRPAHTEPLPQTDSLVMLPWRAKLSLSGHLAASLQPYMVLRFPGKAKLKSSSGLGVDPPSVRTPLLLAKNQMPVAGLRGWMASSSPGLKLHLRS